MKDENKMKNKSEQNKAQKTNAGVKVQNGQVSIDTQTLNDLRPPDCINFHYVFYIPEHNVVRIVNMTLN